MGIRLITQSWSDLLELLDERTSGFGALSVIAAAASFALATVSLAYTGLGGPVAVILGSATLIPPLAWAIASRTQRPLGGLVGLGPSTFATLILANTLGVDHRLDDGWWWTLLWWWPPAILAGVGVVAWAGKKRPLESRRLAWATALLASGVVPLTPLLAEGWFYESREHVRGPFIWLGIPMFVILLHLVWAAFAIVRDRHLDLLPLRVLGRIEILFALGGVSTIAYVARLPLDGPYRVDSLGWRLGRDSALAPLVGVVLLAVGYHGYRLSRWADAEPEPGVGGTR